MTHRRPLLVAMGLATLFATALSANHSWGNYHWARTSNPFTLKVGANVSSVWISSLTGAISDWSQSSVMNLVQVAGGTRPRNCRATAGRIEVCSERYGRNGWLGIAQIWVAGDHITQATTKVNDTYFSPNYAGGYYNTSAWRNFVMCQEIGHDFGLDHQDENFDNPPLGSCMDYSDPPDANQHPNAHDYEQLVTIYSHTDATTTVGQTPGKMTAGIRVVADGADGTIPAVGQAAVRALVSLVTLGTAGLGFLPGLVSHDRRALHDRLAGTRVIRLS